MELKSTNDGKHKFSNEFTGLFKVSDCKFAINLFLFIFLLQDIEGFEDSAVTTSGTVSSADGMKLDVGFMHNGKDHKFNIKASAEQSPTVETSTVWRPMKEFVIAEKSTLK